MAVTIHLPGEPVAWSRAGKSGKTHFTPAKQRAFMAALGAMATRAMAGCNLLDGPLGMVLTATYAWPKRMTKKRWAEDGYFLKPTRPDLSNLVKIAEDALNGIVYRDDAQITRAFAEKRYGDEPGLTIAVCHALDMRADLLQEEPS